MLPVVNGEPVWTHRCADEAQEERLGRIEGMLEQLLKDKRNG